MRIISTITSSPIIEQFKLHTNRFEVNGNGFTEYFGTSRYRKTLISGVDHLIPNNVGTPKDMDVLYTPTATAGYTDNRFESTVNDSTCFVLDINEGLDTSIPIEVSLSFYVNGTGTGDIELVLEKIPVTDGYVYDGANSIGGSATKIVTVATDKDLVRQSVLLHLDVNEATPSTAYLMIVRRDASAGNLNDTLAEDVILTHFKVNGYFWKP
jgi:hypothetical protein